MEKSFFPHFTLDVVTYRCWDQSKLILVPGCVQHVYSMPVFFCATFDTIAPGTQQSGLQIAPPHLLKTLLKDSYQVAKNINYWQLLGYRPGVKTKPTT